MVAREEGPPRPRPTIRARLDMWVRSSRAGRRDVTNKSSVNSIWVVGDNLQVGAVYHSKCTAQSVCPSVCPSVRPSLVSLTTNPSCRMTQPPEIGNRCGNSPDGRRRSSRRTDITPMQYPLMYCDRAPTYDVAPPGVAICHSDLLAVSDQTTVVCLLSGFVSASIAFFLHDATTKLTVVHARSLGVHCRLSNCVHWLDRSN